MIIPINLFLLFRPIPRTFQVPIPLEHSTGSKQHDNDENITNEEVQLAIKKMNKNFYKKLNQVKKIL